MKKIFCLFLLTLCFLYFNCTSIEDNFLSAKGIILDDVKSLSITYRVTYDSIEYQQFIVTDTEKIKNLVSLLQQLPSEGIVAIKMGTKVPYYSISVSNDPSKIIEIFNGQVKLVNTFFLDSRRTQMENKILSILETLK